MSDTPIDKLTIEIDAEAQNANDAVDVLAGKIEKLVQSFSKIDTNKIEGLAKGMKEFGSSMQDVNAKNANGVARLANSIVRLSKVDVNSLKNVASELPSVAESFNKIGSVSIDAQKFGELASSISRLGNKSATKAIENIPKLSSAMKDLMKNLSTAPKVSQNLIDMTNALAKLARTGASSGKAASSLVSSFQNIGNSSNFALSGIKKINTSLKSLLKTVAPFVGVWQLFSISKQAMEISSDLTEIQNVVDVTFGDFKQKIEDLAETSISTLGMSELTTKEISSRFQAMGTAMGFSTEKMSDMSVELTRLTGDMASFYNVSQKDVGKALQSIFTGETEPMRKYGIDLTNATIQQWALNKGLDVSVNKMTQLQKATLRYQYVLENTGAAQGDFIRTQDTWANQIAVLKQQLQQLASVIGGSLINALKPLVKALNAAMSHIIAFAKTVSNALGAIFGWKYEVGGGITSDLETGAGAADNIASGLGDAANNAKKLKTHLLSIDELNVVEPDDDNSSSGSSGGGLGGFSDLDIDYGQWKQTESLLESYKSDIESLYELGQYIGDALINAMNSIDWESIYEKARNFGTGFAEFLNGLISPELFGTVGKTIASSLNTAIYAALSFGETFDWTNLGESIAEGINQFFATFDFADLANTIDVWVQGIWTTIKTTIEDIEWKDVWNGAKEFLENIDLETVAIIIGAVTVKRIGKAILQEGIISWLGRTLSSLITNVPIVLSNIKILAGGGLIAETGFVSKLANALALAAGGAATLHEALTLAFGTVATTIAGIISIIGGVLLSTTSFFSMWKDGFSWLKEAFMALGVILTGIGAVILGAPVAITAVIAAATFAIGSIAVIVHDNWEKVKEFFSDLWESITEIWSSFTDWFENDVLQVIVDSFFGFLDSLQQSLEETGEFFKDFFTEKVTWIYENVILTVVGFFQEFWENITNIFLTLWEKIQEIWSVVSNWFNQKVITPTVQFFTNLYNKVRELFHNLWEKIKGIWIIVSSWFEENVIEPVAKNFALACDNIKNFFENLWKGIKKGVAIAMNAVIDTVEKAVNGIIRLLNTLHWEIPDWVPGVGGKSFGFNIQPISLKRIEIPAYSAGGVVEDGLFYMNHNELIGKFSGSGKTTVTNNEQILDGIENGVERAVSRVLAPYLEEIAQNTREAADKDFDVSLDGRSLLDGLKQRSIRNGYSFT